ncbi:hypothetical protein AJ80_02100 [Polytolypa hystricis UAMH7299]|uniref:EF-hand domain-containing protein n=1 Tax=Polytolypa hystricis (strain UAMH7299) TaxID=1447883 RepID=A0A2B7YSL0_POLH7|nr:hypothetical protein AJ80_02100 [Polytolypa hystricis UAMH7299]
MAYKGSYNPDALPAHAEPEQVAQMLGAIQGGRQPQAQSQGPPPPNRFSTSNYPPQHPQNGRQNQAPPPASYQRPHAGSTSRIHSPPPPQNYGFGPRPDHPAQNRPPPTSQPPRTPQPGHGVPLSSNNPSDLFPLFRAANASNTGSLTRAELGSALVNGDYTSFDPYTVTMMIRMFDRDGNGTVGFDEFVALWRFLAAWRDLFDRFDVDRSGRISFQEFSNALIAFGYMLSPSFVAVMFSTFESRGRGKVAPVPGQKGGMSFDLFIQACITLKRMTDVFKKYDEDRDGYVTLSFEEFLTAAPMLKKFYVSENEKR